MVWMHPILFSGNPLRVTLRHAEMRLGSLSTLCAVLV